MLISKLCLNNHATSIIDNRGDAATILDDLYNYYPDCLALLLFHIPAAIPLPTNSRHGDIENSLGSSRLYRTRGYRRVYGRRTGTGAVIRMPMSLVQL